MRETRQEFRPKHTRPRARRHARPGLARRHTLLQLEPLEARVVPTVITIGSSKDNTLYENSAGNLSNGAGEGFFAGTTNQGGKRRGVIAFNIASNIPAGATINSVTLRLNVSQTNFGSGAQTVELRRLLADWGEGTSNSNVQGGGGGTAATTNDATWVHRFFNTSTWATPGGDFSTTVSASNSVNNQGAYTWGSTAQMVADVQAWLNNTSSNFGWLVLGNEATNQTAKRFDTKENSNAANRPMLTIDYTAGGFTPISISGQKYNDLNGNGVKDTGEPGLQGWTIYLDTNNNGTADSGEPTATTDANGNYTFTGLGAGTYRPREVAQAGWVQTTANPADIVAQSGTNVTGRDFGNFRRINISGQKYNDLNGNGAKDTGEPGLQGWTIFLDANGNGTLDSGETSVTTDASGNYTLSNLGPGTYRVREVAQTGWVQTTTNPADIVAQSGTNVTGRDFGNAQRISISGQKFNDLNGNGARDTGEPGLQGWTIFLDANNNGNLDSGETSVTTDASGNYTFTGLSAGTYRVREVAQAGWVQTTANPADIVGTTATGVNFGNFQRISISGQKYNDLNGNGSKDSGEPGLQGWTIFLDANGNGNLDSGEASVTTDASGNYTLTNVGPGTHRVREVAQTGWVQTTTNPADIVAQSGTNVAGRDLGNFRRISISGQVFNDRNGDGTRQGREPGQRGWTVFLDANGNGSLDTGETSATTDRGGNYNFADVGPGTHRIRVVAQTAWVQTTANPADIVAQSGTNVAGRDLGVFERASISGQAFHDLNGNGAKDAAEPGLQGRTIFLDANDNGTLDSGETSVTTDASGNYTLTNLAPGTYRVREVAQTGWLQTTANPANLVASSGFAATGVNFGNFQRISISGQKYNDLNGNGSKDSGEPGLQGWTIFLDANGNGNLDSGEASVTTDASGNYTLTNVGPGTHRVREVAQTGWVQTTTNPADIVAQSGTNITGRDLGNFRRISISGVVFNDVNGDGVKQAAEPGQQGWTVFLDANGNGTPDSGEASATSDTNGSYTLADVGPGTHRVRLVAQTGWLPTTGTPADVVATSGSNVTRNLGNARPGIAGRVIEDTNGNGAADAGEPGLSGWTVYLDGNNNGALDTGETSVTTNADGGYGLVNLATGNYTVRVVVPTGWVQSQPAGPGFNHAVAFTSGQLVAGRDFASFRRGEISGSVFEDVNANAARDTGEPALQNWTVFLDANANGALDSGEASTTTNASGAYSFANLNPGSYLVRVVVQAGWEQSVPAAPGLAHAVSLASGQTVTGRDFGTFRRGEIRGVVFNDQNNNRARDAAETGLAGWVVYLDQNGNAALDQRQVTAVSTDVPKAIPDVSTVTSTLVVNNQAGAILDVNVTLTITHTWVADLDVFLVSPTGTRIELFTDVGGSGDNFTNTTLDDEATLSITLGDAPFTGSFRPEGLLAALLGQSANGTWTLEIRDVAAPDPGVLVNWSLAFSLANEPVSVSSATGAYAFANLMPGSYQVREVVRPGWTQTLPGTPDFRYNVSLNSGQTVVDRDFGNVSAGLESLGQGPGGSAVKGKLTPVVLQPLVEEAIARWQGTGIDAGRLATLAGVQVQVTDLPGALLGMAAGNVIWIDEDAAGWGWFIDATPADDSEFGVSGPASGRIDLLTVIAHEMGHLLGLGHSHGDDLMGDVLGPGERRVPEVEYGHENEGDDAVSLRGDASNAVLMMSLLPAHEAGGPDVRGDQRPTDDRTETATVDPFAGLAVAPAGSAAGAISGGTSQERVIDHLFAALGDDLYRWEEAFDQLFAV